MAGNKKSGRKSVYDERRQGDLRDRINGGRIISKLCKHINGEEEHKMDSTQVTAALGLLKKILPDLQNVEHSGSVENEAMADLVSAIDQRMSAIPSEQPKPNGAANGSGSVH